VVVASFPIANHCIRSIISFCNHTLHFYFDTEDVQEGHLNLLLAAQLLWLLCEQPPCELLLPTGELFLTDTPSQVIDPPAQVKQRGRLFSTSIFIRSIEPACVAMLYSNGTAAIESTISVRSALDHGAVTKAS
jgi:hypothetical protein